VVSFHSNSIILREEQNKAIDLVVATYDTNFCLESKKTVPFYLPRIAMKSVPHLFPQVFHLWLKLILFPSAPYLFMNCIAYSIKWHQYLSTGTEGNQTSRAFYVSRKLATPRVQRNCTALTHSLVCESKEYGVDMEWEETVSCYTVSSETASVFQCFVLENSNETVKF